MTENYLDDDLLIRRSQGGDRNAFDMLVHKHEAKAYQYAFRLTHSPEQACDVVSEAFVRVFNARHNFKGQSQFSTWLYRILTNCFLDAKKRDRSKSLVSLDSMAQTAEGEVARQFEDPGRSPAEETERNERERRIQDAVGLLPEYQRSMIVMYHAENLSYEEIAAAMDLPIGTVKSRLNRARMALREFLVKDEELFKLG